MRVPTILEADQKEFFDTHGWLVVRGALGGERVAEITRIFDEIFPAGQYSGAGAVPLPGVLQVLNTCRAYDLLHRHLFDEVVGGTAARLLGCREIKLLQDTLLLKPPRAGGRVEWHQDYTYTGYLDPPRAVSVRLALNECTVATGCLAVLDGSHRWEVTTTPRPFADDRVEDALAALPEALRERAASAVVPVELAPGDLSIHHCLTFHSSLPNHSDRPRKTIITHVFDGDCTVIATRLPHPEAVAAFPTDERGRLVGPAFPTLYQASVD